LQKLHVAGFHSSVDWREGIRRQVATMRPELLKN